MGVLLTCKHMINNPKGMYKFLINLKFKYMNESLWREHIFGEAITGKLFFAKAFLNLLDRH